MESGVGQGFVDPLGHILAIRIGQEAVQLLFHGVVLTQQTLVEHMIRRYHRLALGADFPAEGNHMAGAGRQISGLEGGLQTGLFPHVHISGLLVFL